MSDHQSLWIVRHSEKGLEKCQKQVLASAVHLMCMGVSRLYPDGRCWGEEVFGFKHADPSGLKGVSRHLRSPAAAFIENTCMLG